jgi:hypothetical protein
MHPRSLGVVTSLGTTYRLVHDLARHDGKLVMFLLTQRPESLHRLLLGTAAAAHHDADRTVDHASGFQGGSQLID